MIEMGKKQSLDSGGTYVRSASLVTHLDTRDPEAVALWKKCKRLNQRLKTKELRLESPAATVAAIRTKPAGGISSRQAQSPSCGDDRFCYRCGEDGHIATKCSSA